MQLLGTARTPFGRACLVGWLLAPASTEEIRRRQEAVRELAPKLDLRQELSLAGGEGTAATTDTEPFLAWAEGEPWLLPRRVLVAASWLLPIAGFALLAAALADVLPWSLWFLVVLTNLGLAYVFGKPAGAIFDHVEGGEGGFTAYGQALAVAVREPAASARLRHLQEAMDANTAGTPAHEAMEKLARLVVLGDVRHSALGNQLAQGFLLWDFHVLARLERWQVTHGRHARRWLTALGEVEALAALASLSFENPEWCFAEIDAREAPQLSAAGLGHPLLPPERRVDNDVSLGPPGTFLLVTGSNMSGKSTLLRALGVDVVLALSGGPACARSLSLPPVELGTSLLVEDSLASGVSFFLAELQRLKAILDAAVACHARGTTLLFLLDEVLRGTNSAERRIAVRRVLLRLAELSGVGAVTTHDLAMAEDPAIAAAMQPVHFRETLHPAGDGPPMTFDYQLRPGLATTVNALKLLEMVGIEA
jgi:DNA mismatch repair ATPase MutS